MNKKEVGLRLREFLMNKFGKLTLAAEKLEIGPQNLNKYLNGVYIPGGKLIARLSELGCDTKWLFGIDEADKVSDDIAEYEVKDKVIIQQAEEIFKLRKQILDYTFKVEELTKQTKSLMERIEKSLSKGIEVSVDKFKETPKNKKYKVSDLTDDTKLNGQKRKKIKITDLTT